MKYPVNLDIQTDLIRLISKINSLHNQDQILLNLSLCKHTIEHELSLLSAINTRSSEDGL